MQAECQRALTPTHDEVAPQPEALDERIDLVEEGHGTREIRNVGLERGVVVQHEREHRLRVRVPGDLRRPFVFGLDLLEVAVRLVTPRAHKMRPRFEYRIADPSQRRHHLRGRLTDLGRRAVRDEMLDAAHEEPRSCDGVDAIQQGQQGCRRELEPLGRAIGFPQQGVHAAGRFDATARVERVCLVETRLGEICGASDVTGQARSVGRVEQQRRVIDAGDRGRVVEQIPTSPDARS